MDLHIDLPSCTCTRCFQKIDLAPRVLTRVEKLPPNTKALAVGDDGTNWHIQADRPAGWLASPSADGNDPTSGLCPDCVEDWQEAAKKFSLPAELPASIAQPTVERKRPQRIAATPMVARTATYLPIPAATTMPPPAVVSQQGRAPIGRPPQSIPTTIAPTPVVMQNSPRVGVPTVRAIPGLVGAEVADVSQIQAPQGVPAIKTIPTTSKAAVPVHVATLTAPRQAPPTVHGIPDPALASCPRPQVTGSSPVIVDQPVSAIPNVVSTAVGATKTSNLIVTPLKPTTSTKVEPTAAPIQMEPRLDSAQMLDGD